MWDPGTGQPVARSTTDGLLYGCAVTREGTILDVGALHHVHILDLEGDR